MNVTDHYKTLGVSRTASRNEIRSAWRIKARENHPDHNTSADAPEKFRKASDAWAILGNDETRKNYDKQTTPSASQYGNTSFSNSTHTPGYTETHYQPSRDVFLRDTIEIIVDIRDAYVSNAVITVNSGLPGICAPCSGQGYMTRFYNGQPVFSICAHCHGTGMLYGNSEIKIRLPPGIRNGEILSFRHSSGYMIRISVIFRKNRTWKIQQYDICMSRRFSAERLQKGTTCTVKLPDGKALRIRVPAGTLAGTWLRISGKGMPEKETKRGNLRIKILQS